MVTFVFAFGAYSSVEFQMLADSAADGNGYPLNRQAPSGTNFQGIGGGRYNGRGDIGGFSYVQTCQTVFTNSGAGWFGQLVCYIQPY